MTFEKKTEAYSQFPFSIAETYHSSINRRYYTKSLYKVQFDIKFTCYQSGKIHAVVPVSDDVEIIQRKNSSHKCQAAAAKYF